VVWYLPYSRIDAFKAQLTYEGKVVSSEAVISFREFNGGADTTLDAVKSYYSQAAVGQIPSLMTGASVMGENVVDLGGENVGRMALRKTMLGSVGGSVAGLVAVDSSF